MVKSQALRLHRSFVWSPLRPSIGKFPKALSRFAAAAAGALAAALMSALPMPSGAQTTTAREIAGQPLVIGTGSHVVVLEYEAWFGPNAVTFQNAEAMPHLQSRDMRNFGGGYDSADPHVIAQHVRWMQYMGIDASSIDLTNNVGCIFSSGPVSSEFCNPATKAFRRSNRSVCDNIGNLYPAWSNLG